MTAKGGVYHAVMNAPWSSSSASISSSSSVTRQSVLAIGEAHVWDLLSLARLQRRAFPPRLAYSLPTLAQLWALPWVRLLVARRGEIIVGCVIGDRTMEGGRVINLAVDPAARRQGVATALLHQIERSLPRGDMTLMVQADNSGARGLYRRLGYVDAGELENYYGPGRAGVWMRKPRR